MTGRLIEAIHRLVSRPVVETITLVGRDLRQACRLACDRIRGERTATVASPDSYSGPSISERHFVGLLAEIAVAEYFGLQINTATSTDPGYDFPIEFDGERGGLDSKGSTHDDPRLLVTEGSVDSEFYVLSRVNLREYSVDCQQNTYVVNPNKIVLDRRPPVGDRNTDESTRRTESVEIDLLGWATKEDILDAEVLVHSSSPSHTLSTGKLRALPVPSAVIHSTDSRPPKWDR